MKPAAPTNLVFVVALLVALGLLSALIFRPFVSYLLLGALIVYLTFPLFRRLVVWTKRPRLAASILLLGLFLSILVPLGWLGWELFNETRGITAALTPEEVARQIDTTVRGTLLLVGVAPDPDAQYGRDVIDAAVPALQSFAQARLPSFLALLASLFIGAFVLAFAVFYGYLDGPAFVDYVRSVLPLSRAQSGELLRDIQRTIDAVFLGQIVGAVVQGILGAIGFLIFGVPGVLFWGLIMIILSVIPFVGAFLIWMPAAIWLLAQGHTVQGIGLLLWGALLVSNVDNFVKPLLIGSRARIHPIVVLVGVLGGLFAFGVMGFVLGPLVLSLFIAVLQFWREDYLPAYRRAREAGGEEPSGAPQAP